MDDDEKKQHNELWIMAVRKGYFYRYRKSVFLLRSKKERRERKLPLLALLPDYPFSF